MHQFIEFPCNAWMASCVTRTVPDKYLHVAVLSVRGLCCHSEGPRQAGALGSEELHEFQQRQMQGAALRAK